MILEDLTIRRERYGVNEGKLVGEVMFGSPRGKIQIHLNDDTSKKILEVVADQLVESAKEVATNMTADIITSATLIEHKS